MTKIFKVFIFILFAFFLSSNALFSQTNFWQMVLNSASGSGFVISSTTVAVANNGDIWMAYYTVSPGPVYYYGLRLSTDNGSTWNSSPFSSRIDRIAVNPVNGDIFVYDRDYYSYRSTNKGVNWERVSMPVFYDIIFTQFGEIYVASGGVRYSTDMGNTWQNKNSGFLNPDIRCLIMGTDGTLYAGNLAGGVYRSTDGGDNWLPPSNYTNARINGLTISNDGSIFAAAGSIGVLKSTDKGLTWSQINITGLSANYDATRIVYNPKTGHIFITANSASSGVYRSTDLGEKWYKTHNGFPSSNNAIYPFSINSTTGTMFVVVNNSGFYRSTENINKIIDLNLAPTSIDYGTVQAQTSKDSAVYVTNTGETDIVISAVNITGTDASSFLHIFTAVTLKPNETRRFPVVFRPYTAGTKTATMEIVTDVTNAGTNIITLIGNAIPISVEEPEDIMGDGSTFLFQSSPNPIRSGYDATIRYRLNTAGIINIAVYDVLGREVAQLLDEYKPSGVHSVNFNTKNLPSGVYFYKLRTQGYEAQKKMLIIR